MKAKPVLKLLLLGIFSVKRRTVERGFAVPLVLMIGIVTLVSSIMIIFKAVDEKEGQSTKQTTNEALSIAELAVTRYQNFLLEHPALAVYPDCEGTRNGNGVCPDSGSVASWSNAAVVPDVTVNAEITTAANSTWRDVQPGDLSKGQIRIVSYSFDNDDNPATPVDLTAPGVATLEVEGRVKQSSNGQEVNSTGTSRLRVRFDVTPGSGSPSVAELWIDDNDVSGGSTSGTIQADIKDSTPLAGNNSGNVTKLKALQPVITPPYTYEENSPTPFPPLPPEGQLANVPASSCTIATKVDTATTFPRACTPGGVTYNTYRFTDPTSFDLGGGDVITADAPGQKVFWYVEGKLKMTHATAKIEVTPGTTLVIYAHDEVSLTGGSDVGGALSNPGGPDNIQLYNYSNQEIKLTGSSGSKGFIFSPNARVSMTGSGGMIGTIWAKGWHGTGSTGFTSGTNPPNCSNLSASFSSICGTSNKIGSITSWERVAR